jgi:hypothetical protein
VEWKGERLEHHHHHQLWCSSLCHYHFCIAEIGRAVLLAFLIPLLKMLYLVIGTTLQDRISIAQKLSELLILTDCQFGRGSLLLYLAGIQPPRQHLNLPYHHRTLNRACTSTEGAFCDLCIINIHCLERSHKTKNINWIILKKKKTQWQPQIGHCGCAAQPLYIVVTK